MEAFSEEGEYIAELEEALPGDVASAFLPATLADLKLPAAAGLMTFFTPFVRVPCQDATEVAFLASERDPYFLSSLPRSSTSHSGSNMPEHLSNPQLARGFLYACLSFSP